MSDASGLGALQANDAMMNDSSREAAVVTIQRQVRGFRSRQRVWRYIERLKASGDKWMAIRTEALEKSQSRNAAARVGAKNYSRYAIMARVCFFLGFVPSCLVVIFPYNYAVKPSGSAFDIFDDFGIMILALFFVVAGAIAAYLMEDPIVNRKLAKGCKAFLCTIFILVLCAAAGGVYYALEYETEQSTASAKSQEVQRNADRFHQAYFNVFEYAWPKVMKYEGQNEGNKTETRQTIRHHANELRNSVILMLKPSARRAVVFNMQSDRNTNYSRDWHSDNAEWNSEVLSVSAAKSVAKATAKWGWRPATFFSMTVVSTVGYGAYTPLTSAGKVFTVLLACVGIPLFGLCVLRVGEFLITLNELLMEIVYDALAWITRCLRRSQAWSKRHCESQQRVLTLMFVGFWLVGSYTHMDTFDLASYGDAVYFVFITLSSVGFGTFTPPVKSDAYWNFMIYIVVGMALLSLLFNYYSETIEARQTSLSAYYARKKSDAFLASHMEELKAAAFRQSAVEPDDLAMYYLRYRLSFNCLTVEEHRWAALQLAKRQGRKQLLLAPVLVKRDDQVVEDMLMISI